MSSTFPGMMTISLTKVSMKALRSVSSLSLAHAIQAAFDRRTTHSPDNTRALFKYNRQCP